MSEWRDISIEDLCSRVTSGGTPSRKRSEFYADGGIPWVKSQELVEARIAATGEHITAAGLKGSSAKLLPPDTVLMAMYGANVGQLGWLGIEATVNQAICAMVTDPDVTDARFLYYALAGARRNLIAQAHGAAQQNLSQQLIKPFKLRAPGIDLQRKIGSMLRSFDDLIELNRRRVGLLETMAAATYGEWVAQLDDSAPVALVASIDRSSVIPSRTPDVEFDHYSLPAFDSGQLPGLERGSEIHSGKFRLGNAAVLVSKLNPRIERTWLFVPSPERQGIASTEFLVVRPTPPLSKEWLYLACRSAPVKERMRELSNGTSNSHQRVKPEDFLAIEIPQPSPADCDELTRAVVPMLSLAASLRKQIRLTGEVRDAMLPKVITGQIDVSALAVDALVGGQVA